MKYEFTTNFADDGSNFAVQADTTSDIAQAIESSVQPEVMSFSFHLYLPYFHAPNWLRKILVSLFVKKHFNILFR